MYAFMNTINIYFIGHIAGIGFKCLLFFAGDI